MLLCYGRPLFSKSVDDPSLFAQTVFGIMLVCLNRSQTFLTGLILISKLTSGFSFEQG